MKLWLDDERLPPDDTWVWAKTAPDAIEHLKSGVVVEVSLDHDLAAEHYDPAMYEGVEAYDALREGFSALTGYDVVKWMAENTVWPSVIRVHTMNPAGGLAMRQVINRWAPDSLKPRLPYRFELKGAWGV